MRQYQHGDQSVCLCGAPIEFVVYASRAADGTEVRHAAWWSHTTVDNQEHNAMPNEWIDDE
jgi:hypothetical protein